jgi:hypothetical protein
MNLRVDLILPEERRSASRISPKLLVRGALVFALLVVVLGVTVVYLKATAVMRQRNAARDIWQGLEPKYKKAVALEKELRQNQMLLADLLSIRNSRMNWVEQLRALHRVVPENVQITRVNFEETMGKVKNTPARLFTLTIYARAYARDESRTFGGDPQQDVKEMERRLVADEHFSKCLRDVAVVGGSFAVGRWPGAVENDRQFSIRCIYRPMEIK